MPNTPTTQLLALVAAIIMLAPACALIVYRWANALQPSAISR
jgi:hypothetical protein